MGHQPLHKYLIITHHRRHPKKVSLEWQDRGGGHLVTEYLLLALLSLDALQARHGPRIVHVLRVEEGRCLCPAPTAVKSTEYNPSTHLGHLNLGLPKIASALPRAGRISMRQLSHSNI